jgi:hypothetical protein
MTNSFVQVPQLPRSLLPRTKAPFLAKHGRVSDSTGLIARAASRRTSYEWRYGLDQKTWTTAPLTFHAKTTLHGLTPGQSSAFRGRAVTKAGEGVGRLVVTLVVQ